MRPTSVAVVALALLVAACGTDTGATDAGPGGELRTLEVGLPVDSLGMYGYFAADSLGYYEDEGLDVNLTATGGGAEALQQLVAENFDVAEVAPDAALGVMDELDLYPFFTYFSRSFRDFGIPTDGEVQDVAGLEGMTIGVSSLAGGEVPLVTYVLQQNGVDPESVEIVAVGDEPASILSALESDRIQAFASGQSTFVALEAQGMAFTSLLPEDLASGPIEGLVARAPLQEEPSTLAALGRAVAKGMLFCQTNPDACLDVIGEDRPQLVEDPELARETLDRFLGLTEPPTENGRYIFSPLSRDSYGTILEIFSAGDDPIIDNPDQIDLDNVLDLRDEINDFDYDAVVEQAETHGG